MIFALLIALMDVFLPDLVQGFSLVQILEDIVFLILSWLGWLIYAIQQLTLGSFPFDLLVELLILTVGYFSDAAVELIFLIPNSVFSVIAYLVPLEWSYIQVSFVTIDVKTFTFYLNFTLKYDNGTYAGATVYLTILGSALTDYNSWGFGGKMFLKALGTWYAELPLSVTLEGIFKEMIQALLNNASFSPYEIFQEFLRKAFGVEI